jgi:hypothetical protein
MSDVNPTNSASYRPGDEKRGYNELITLTLTDRECADLMNAVFEFTSGPFSPSDEEWEWLENVMNMPTQDSLEELGRKIGRFRGCYDDDDSHDNM